MACGMFDTLMLAPRPDSGRREKCKCHCGFTLNDFEPLQATHRTAQKMSRRSGR